MRLENSGEHNRVDSPSGRGPRFIAAVWRSSILVAVAFFWMIPEAWHFEAKHSPIHFLLIFATVALAVPGAALTLLIELVLFDYSSSTWTRRRTRRAGWAVLVALHFLWLAWVMSR